MKVVFVLEIPTPYRNPLLARLNAEVDLDVHALYCADTDPLRTWTLVDDHPSEVLPGLRMGGRRGGLNLKMNPAVWARLSALKPDVVLIGGYAHPTMQAAMLWCRRNKVPYLIMSESHSLTPRRRWSQIVKSPIVRWAVGGAAGFLPTGSHAADYLAGWGADRSRMFPFPNVPDVHSIAAEVSALRRDRDSVEKGLGLEGRPRFLFVGRYVRMKGIDVLLDAMAQVQREVPRATASIVGDGPLRAQLEERARALQLQGVTFTGFVEPGQLARHYAVGDVFVLPSFDEPWGVVVLEALAAGLPVVVSSAVGSAADVVEEGVNGHVFSVGDQDALARSLIHTASTEMHAAMSVAAVATAKRFDYEAAAASLRRGLETVAR